MYPRIVLILQYLLHTDSSVTGEQLAIEIGVTSRTIRSDIKVLHDLISSHGAEVQSLRGIGYELKISDRSAFDAWLKKHMSSAAVATGTFMDRVGFVMRTLLLAEGYVKLEKLADQMYVSKSTVQNVLKSVRQRLNVYGLQITTKPGYGLKISGEEYQLRLCIADSFREDVNQTGVDDAEDNGYPLFFSRDEFIEVRDIIIGNMRRHGLFFSDRGLHNLAIHIMIAVRRIREGYLILSLPREYMWSANSKEATAAQDIAAALVSRSALMFYPEYEVEYLTMHLMGTELSIELGDTQRMALTESDQEYRMYVKSMIEEMEALLELGIMHDSELEWGLTLHLKHALSRIRFGMGFNNPMLDSIKMEYPLAFQAAIVGAAKLQKLSGLHISEQEIGYIALHIGAALERLEERYAVKKCIIVCSTGLGSARLLYHKINRHFGSKLEVVGTYGYYNLDQAPLEIIDFIVSTVPLPAELPLPVVQVQTLLQNSDLQQIQRMVLHLGQELIGFIREELTFLQLDLENRDEVISYLCNELESRHLVTPAFLESVKQREQLSSTAFGNRTALPHPLVPQTKETFGVICTLKKPVMWGDKPVQFVCLLCVGKKNQQELTILYDTLIQITESPELVEQLIKAETFRELSCFFS
ncbi:BglG family transcription antiterminator [Paenibacillus riograndensis]|uniref:LicR n=3 Tax=Paenibacillus riograndensis TaxID=483937 RepID=A0A0E3WH42_9BACL|nr:PTS sugar transporter subunit IIA [Paenibacillus riograndensis]CQR54633.1 LicR [Paenibacillus riograndensis SBR5]